MRNAKREHPTTAEVGGAKSGGVAKQKSVGSVGKLKQVSPSLCASPGCSGKMRQVTYRQPSHSQGYMDRLRHANTLSLMSCKTSTWAIYHRPIFMYMYQTALVTRLVCCVLPPPTPENGQSHSERD